MSEREQLIHEIEQIPDILVREVLDFLLFIKAKTNWTTKQEINQNEHYPSFLNFIDQMEQDEAIKLEENLPTDFAKNLDHYLYGSSKE